MRIRLPFAGVFFLLLLLAGYAGLTSLQLDSLPVNDKVLHFVTFFLLTVVFYWILDTSRRRALNLTLATCTAVGGVGSEFLQALLPNGREFDLIDLAANVAGSLAGVGLCSWYHRRMLERKRRTKNYTAVPGEDGEDGGEGGLEDLELGQRIGARDDGQEEGVMVTSPPPAPASAPAPAKTLEQEVDSWDENAVDEWDEDDDGDIGGTGGSKGKSKAADSK